VKKKLGNVALLFAGRVMLTSQVL